MTDNKLNELSKPVAWKFKNADGGDRVSLERKANIYGRHDFQPLYSQEYVSALLAELDAKDNRIAELEDRLSTPVRLPAARFCPSEYEGSLLWSETESHNKAISDCAESLRAAGFTVEGDE